MLPYRAPFPLMVVHFPSEMHIITLRWMSRTSHLNGAYPTWMAFECKISSLSHVVHCLIPCRFLQEELGWHQVKVDELLLPIIQKVGKRVQVCIERRDSSQHLPDEA